MPREIKFRAWDVMEKRWCSNPIVGSIVYEVIVNKDTDVLDHDNHILMQFTGLLDRHGREVYEGDIVTEGGRPYVIEYDDRRAAYNYKTKTSSVLLYLFHGVVIGNIFENKELLDDPQSS